MDGFSLRFALPNGLRRDISQEFDNRRIEAECLWAVAETRGLVSSPDDALDAADEAMDLFLELQATWKMGLLSRFGLIFLLFWSSPALFWS